MSTPSQLSRFRETTPDNPITHVTLVMADARRVAKRADLTAAERAIALAAHDALARLSAVLVGRLP